MEFWATFWTVFFFVSVGIFAMLSIVVIIGGFFDITRMLKKLSTKTDDIPNEKNEPQATVQ